MSKEQTYVDNQNQLKNTIRTYIFDIIATVMIVAFIAINLGILELRDFTLVDFANILVDYIPMFTVASFLSKNYYLKGVFKAKTTQNFTSTITNYSRYVEALTGEHMKALPCFCDEYNDLALQRIQTNILKSAAVSYEEFSTGDKPLKVWTYNELVERYGKERADLIQKAKLVKIKGVKVNGLLGSVDNVDVTDFGLNEKELADKEYKTTLIFNIVGTIIFCLIGVRDVTQWGWQGLIFTLFKVSYIVTRSYLKYFDGYKDITVDLVNYINRKIDILKEFNSWFETSSNK